MPIKKKLLFFLLFSIGLAIRVYFISISPKTLFWDSNSYSNIANLFLNGYNAIDCCHKGSGYPLFLAIIYFLFGQKNIIAVSITNIFFDFISSIALYKISYKLFSKKIAYISLVLFLLNPFTSSYIGYILPETITYTIYLIGLYIIVQQEWEISLIKWFLIGGLLGLLVQLRLSLLMYAFFLGFLLSIYSFLNKRIIGIALFFCGFFLVSLYAVVGYFKEFHVLSLTPPFTMSIPATMYSNQNLGKNPEQLPILENLDPLYTKVNLEFHTSHWAYIPILNQKYNEIFWTELPSKWIKYLSIWIKNIVLIWDKYFLIVFVDPFYPKSILPIRILNILLHFFSYIGLFFMFKGKKRKSHKLFLIATCSLFMYISFIFTLVSNETRHSIIFYPILMIWAAYGIDKVINSRSYTSSRE